MKILGIETSCDDTGVAVVEDGMKILSNVIASQHGFHEPYGGIVPSIAARRHSQNLFPILNKAIDESGISLNDIDAIAVSSEQGLGPSLGIGVSAAKTLAQCLDKPLYAVHHVEGHIYSNIMAFPGELSFPFLCVTVAGGHTLIIMAESLGRYHLIATTRDDSAGEAYDKIARRLGLEYPGGPIIDKLALSGNEHAFNFPRPLMAKPELAFSFSGLKSAVNRTIDDIERRGGIVPIPDICASFQQAVVDIIVSKTKKAISLTGMKSVCLAGGVAANSKLRATLERECKDLGVQFFKPPQDLCVDNAAMIAGLAFHKKELSQSECLELDYTPNAPLGELNVKYKAASKYKKRH